MDGTGLLSLNVKQNNCSVQFEANIDQERLPALAAV